MSWQKCPACNGTGKEFPFTSQQLSCPCSACGGAKIIHTVTGRPPVSKSELKRLDCQGVVPDGIGKISKEVGE